jgi:hypothetical protein
MGRYAPELRHRTYKLQGSEKACDAAAGPAGRVNLRA